MESAVVVGVGPFDKGAVVDKFSETASVVTVIPFVTSPASEVVARVLNTELVSWLSDAVDFEEDNVSKTSSLVVTKDKVLGLVSVVETKISVLSLLVVSEVMLTVVCSGLFASLVVKVVVISLFGAF